MSSNNLSCTLRFLFFFAVLLAATMTVLAQDADEQPVRDPAEAEAVIAKAVSYLGGNAYLNVSTQISRGKFSILRENAVISFQSFYDVIVFPDKERTEFKTGNLRNVQVNVGEAGWVYDGDMEVIRDQTEIQLSNFKKGIRTSLDNLLRRQWKGSARLEYIGKRPATLGKRNDVIKLIYDDGFEVEFEFGADDGIPAKAITRRTNANGEDVVEEDRYAQFVRIGNVLTPFIIDRFTNGVHSSRINVESVEFNKRVSNDIFSKPSDIKTLRKSMTL
ncbi:MAG: hypothetical protein KF685_07680 [Acidobacteria bacterium]|nr:hypothetical protein [Acidobacteriota bacterium]